MATIAPYCAGGKCINNCFASKALKKYCIQQLHMGQQCLKDYGIIKARSASAYNSIISIENFNQMMVNVQIQYKYSVRDTIGVLDTGAQANLISIQELKRLFSICQRTDIQTDNIALEGPTNDKIDYIGTISLLVTLGKKSEQVRFFVVKAECQMLLGMPTLSKFQIVIDLHRQQVYFVDKVNAIQWKSKKRGYNGDITEVLKLNPRKHYQVRSLKPIMLELVVRKHNRGLNLVHQKIIVYDCTCMLNTGNMCTECINSNMGIHFIHPMYTQGVVRIRYTPDLLVDITPKNHVFQAKLWVNKNISVRQVQENDNMSNLKSMDEIQPACWTFENGRISFDINGFKNREICLENNTVTQEPQDTVLEYENSCTVCNKKRLPFCDYKIKGCLSVIRLKNFMYLDENHVKCEIIEVNQVPDINDKNLVIPYYKDTTLVERVNKVLPQYGGKVILQNIKNFEVLCFSDGHCFHYICTGMYAAILETEEQLRKVAIACSKNKLKELHFCWFPEFIVSKRTLKRLFQHLKVKLYLVKNIPDMKESVNRIQFQGQVQANIEEVNPDERLNILIKEDYYINKFKQLAKDLNKVEDKVKSIWAKDGQDIGLLNSGAPHYKVLKFELPLKKGCNELPIPNKTVFVKPPMIPIASAFIEKMLDLGIVKRGYTPYNARTHFIPKQRKELSLQEFVNRGGKEVNYIAGMADNLAPQGVRMINDFNQLNQVVCQNPIVQASTTEQIKMISSRIKYVSVIDITGCYHSIALGEKSQLLTGFDTGLPMGRCYFTRVPMGAGPSKNIQDCALQHIIGNISNLLIYSDNILVLSEEKEAHYQTVKTLLYKLRDHGLKIKPSKTTIMAWDKIKLFGYIISLTDGKLTPTDDKILALRARPIPNSRKELKKFLGSIQFFSQLLPLVTEDLAILNKATRGNEFYFEDREIEAFENIKFLLKDSALLFIHRPDPMKKYYLVVDTSMHHSAWILFQVCKDLHPRILRYGYKSWEESFAKLIPCMRELFGLLVALENVVEEVEYSEKGLLVYTDSLPIVLCAVYSKANAKIARVKIFLESLSFVEISFSPGLSKQILLPDYFTRKYNDPKYTTQKKPTEADIDKCKTIDKLINKSNIYTASKHLFIIDHLLEMEKDKLEMVQPNTIKVDKSGLRYEVGEKENGQQIGPIKVKSINKLYRQCEHKMCNNQVTWIKNIKQICPIRLQIQNEGQHTMDNLKDKVKESEKMKSAKELIGIKPNNGIRIKCAIEEEQIEDLMSLPKNTEFLEDDRNKEIEITEKEEIGTYFSRLIATAKYLDIAKVRNAVKADPYWEHVYRECENDHEKDIKGKKFLLYNKVLFCKETLYGVVMFKLVIPQLMAFELVQQTHRQTGCSKGKKLVNQIRLAFEIVNLEQICAQVTRECFNCSLTARPVVKIRQDLPKYPKRLMEKAQIWAIDELQIVSEKTGRKGKNYYRVICATDIFSHFVVCAPIIGVLTEEKMIDFLQQHIFQVFMKPQVIVTDNATTMDSTLIRGVCAYLGIIKSTIAPYSAKSNLQELINRLILDALRSLTATLYVSPEQFHLLLCPVIQIVNGIVFTNHKFLSPHLIMFGCKPNVDFIQIYEERPEWPENKTEYIKMVVEINNIAHKLRLAQIEGRIYKESSKKVQNYHKKITKGSIVSIRNPELIIKKENFKLRPKFKNRYLVVDKTNSTVLLRPCDEISISYFFDPNYNPKHEPSLFLYKADISNVKLLTNSLILNSNKPSNFYANFYKKNVLPPTFYYNTNEQGLIKISQVESQETVNEDLIVELEKGERSCIRKIRPKSICKRAFSKEIQEIANIFKNLTGIQKIKKVRFEEVVFIIPFRCPDKIYFGQKGYTASLNELDRQLLRKINDNIYCGCKRCKTDSWTGKLSCKNSVCAECVIKPDSQINNKTVSV